MNDPGRPSESHFRMPRVVWFVAAAVTIAALALAFFVIFPFVRQAELVRDIESRGGRVSVVMRGPIWIRWLSGYYTHIHGVPGRRFGIFDQVEAVDLDRTAFDRGLLARLQTCPNLRSLDLSYSAVTDDDMPAISRIQSIRSLDLAHCRVSGRGFGSLEIMPYLTTVNMTYTPVRDIALEHLDEVANLDKVCLYYCRHLSPQGFADFKTRNPHIKFLGEDSLERVWQQTGRDH